MGRWLMLMFMSIDYIQSTSTMLYQSNREAHSECKYICKFDSIVDRWRWTEKHQLIQFKKETKDVEKQTLFCNRWIVQNTKRIWNIFNICNINLHSHLPHLSILDTSTYKLADIHLNCFSMSVGKSGKIVFFVHIHHWWIVTIYTTQHNSTLTAQQSAHT